MPWKGSAALAANCGGHSLLLPLAYTDTIGVVVFTDDAIEPQGAQIGFMSRCVDQVAVALTAAHMVAANAQTTTELREALENRQLLLDTIAELDTPVLPLHPGVVLLPLVSSVDGARMARIRETLLHEVSRSAARVVLLDVTGVPIIDTHVAGEIIQLARSVRLLGGTTIMVGIRPEMAQTLVNLGVDVSEMKPRATLAEGLEGALALLGVRLVRRTS